jgi:hypothetical protein
MIPGLRRLALAALALAPAAAPLATGCHEDVILGADPPPFCQEKPCGTGCTLDSMAPGVCDAHGACTAVPPPCPGKLACEGQACGAPCAPPQLMPPPPPGIYFCDAMQKCEPGPHACMPPPDPCHGLHCGELCNPGCDPQTDGGCPPPPMPSACDPKGHCMPADMVGCMGAPPWFPCMGKKCGDACTLCPPGDPMCMEAPMPKACDPSGTCQPGAVSCP